MKNWNTGMRIVLLLLIMASRSAQGQEVPIAGLLDAKAIAADPRLNGLVELDTSRVRLRQILERVSAQTGVAVSIPATDPLSGIWITCHVKNLSLADFLNSLWSLVGYDKATWQITTDVEHTLRSYRFLPTLQARTLPDLLKRQSDTAAENLWKLLKTISLAPAKERQAFIIPLTAAWQSESDASARRYLQDSPDANVGWDMISIVPTELSAEQQEQLQKGVGISIPLSSMTPAHQELMRPYGRVYTTKDGVRIEKPPKDHMTFKYKRSLGSQKYLIRDLWIGVNYAGEFGGNGILSPLETGLKQRLAEGWILPGDAKHSEKETSILKVAPDLSPRTTTERAEALDRLLMQVADAQNVSYMAIVPEEIVATLPSPGGKSMAQLFDDLRQSTGMMHKWRKDVLLCNYHGWFYGEEGSRPYAATQ